jgi:D-alanyl-D-alanine carboxypeptidase
MLDLLSGLLLPSGNDAALAIARAVSGGDEAFVALMNERAAELGLADTHFANPHGLDAPDHFSSAADLARLTRVALRNPILAQIVATQQKTVRGRIAYDLRNTNPLLGRPDVEGVKTGHTELAGACLVAAVRRGGHRVLVVVLASPDARAETLALADYAFSAYAWPDLSLPAGPFDLDPTTGQRAALSQRPAVVLPRWQVPYLRGGVGPAPGQASFFVADSRLPIAVAPTIGGNIAP